MKLGMTEKNDNIYLMDRISDCLQFKHGCRDTWGQNIQLSWTAWLRRRDNNKQTYVFGGMETDNHVLLGERIYTYHMSRK